MALGLQFLFLAGTFAQGDETSGRPAKIFTVTGTDQVASRSYPGIVYPSQEVELSFRVGGRLIELPVRASNKVEENTVIAKIDPRDYQAEFDRLLSSKDQAVAELDVLRTGARPEEIAALEAAVEAAVAQLELARDQYERTLQLRERGVATSAQLGEQETSRRVAEANLRAELERLAIGRAGGRPEEILAAEAAIRGLEAQIRTARDNLADTELRAPFDGTIARRYVENFSNIQAGKPIVLLQKLSTVEVVFDLPGTDVATMATLGAENISNFVRFDAVPGVDFDTELVEFSTQADPATQTYRGRVSVAIPEGTVVLPGMVANVIVNVRTAQESVLSVPVTALAAAPDGSSFVWVVDPESKSVKRQPVTIAEVVDDQVNVTDGLSEGAQIVSAGVSQLQEGMTIRPVAGIGD